MDAQGEMLNGIEKNVTSATDAAIKGTEEMRRAVKSQKQARKKMCCILLSVLVLIIVATIIGVLFK